MSYLVYLGNLLLPVPPESIQIKIQNQNSTITLINEAEYNFLKSPGLTEISFDILLPAFKYPFAVYENGFKDQKYFLDEIKKLKLDKKSFKFSVNRELPNGKGLYDTKFKNVSLEEYTIKEEANNGFDLTVSIELKEYNPIKTDIADISEDGTITKEQQREESDAEPSAENQSYTVKSGDTLWALSKYYYGDGSKYSLIASANPGITNPNLIYPGQVLVIPKEE